MKNVDSDRSVKVEDGPCHAENGLVDFHRDHPSFFQLPVNFNVNELLVTFPAFPPSPLFLSFQSPPLVSLLRPEVLLVNGMPV